MVQSVRPVCHSMKRPSINSACFRGTPAARIGPGAGGARGFASPVAAPPGSSKSSVCEGDATPTRLAGPPACRAVGGRVSRLATSATNASGPTACTSALGLHPVTSRVSRASASGVPYPSRAAISATRSDPPRR